MANIKDVGAVRSKNGVEVRVGFEHRFQIYSRSVFFKFPKKPWRMLGEARVVNSEEALKLMENVFRECVVTVK